MEGNFVEVTWRRVFKVWWCLAWRAALITFAGSLMLGFALGIVGAVIGMPTDLIKFAATVMSYVVATAVFIIVLWRILDQRKSFSDFRISLIEKEQSST